MLGSLHPVVILVCGRGPRSEGSPGGLPVKPVKPVKLVVYYSIQQSAGVKEQKLEDIPSSHTDLRGASEPIVINMRRMRYFVEPAMQDTIQGTVWVEEQMLEVIPISLTYQCG